MCGFLVYLKGDVSKEEFAKSLDKILHRGPDMSEVMADDTGLWGFNRLTIMDLSPHGMQPFDNGSVRVVCNGELYGFRALKKELEYDYTSESDCELLIPLYLKYGTDMFAKLDAEFACVLYDKDTNTLLAARDPIGIRPLFYGYSKVSGNIMFGSEVKALIDLCDKIEAFPPGYYYCNGQFVQYHDCGGHSAFVTGTLDEITAGIKERLVEGVLKRLDADAPLGFLLSGGLDSSLVCAIAAKTLNKKIRTFCIGMSHDAIDMKYAKMVADHLGSDHTEVRMTKEEILSALREIIYLLETWDITTIRASIGMYLVCKYIRENTDIKVLLTGEISDELFGYKYTDFAPTPEEFQKEAEKRLRELYCYDVLRADRCISGCSIEARVPFGDLAFIDYVMGIDPAIKMNTYNEGKYLLRRAFEGDYLPQAILHRDKAAFSDAVGHSLADYLKERAEELYTEEDVAHASEKYPVHTPFTKESLMYREIFEEFYPGQAHLIKDFWMPNKEWPGCNVNDPSARVLSNYGASGK